MFVERPPPTATAPCKFLLWRRRSYSGTKSGPLRVVHLSRHKWPGGCVNWHLLGAISDLAWRRSRVCTLRDFRTGICTGQDAGEGVANVSYRMCWRVSTCSWIGHRRPQPLPASSSSGAAGSNPLLFITLESKVELLSSLQLCTYAP